VPFYFINLLPTSLLYISILLSDHASLRHLFQQKAPSERILRLCDFLADFDFQEVRVVKGTDNAVPDF
jgi:hypothetical protein